MENDFMKRVQYTSAELIGKGDKVIPSQYGLGSALTEYTLPCGENQVNDSIEITNDYIKGLLNRAEKIGKEINTTQMTR